MSATPTASPSEAEARASYLQSMGEQSLVRGRFLGGTMGIISLFFGTYEFFNTPLET